MEIAGHAPVKLTDASSGEDAGYPTGHQPTRMLYESLLENPV